MKWRYPKLGPWLSYKRNLILEDWDDLTIITAREGKGKSKLARKIARQLDPSFTLERVFFDWDDYDAWVGEAQPGQAAVLDEFRGHRRLSMTKERMSVLEEFKENRGLGLHHFIVFNRFTKLDLDLTTDRVADWLYLPKRGTFEVRQPHTTLFFDGHGQPVEPTTYPQVGPPFRFTDTEPPGWAAGYKAMKVARMRDRYARKRGLIDGEETAPEPPARKPMINPAILAEVQAELRRGI